MENKTLLHRLQIWDKSPKGLYPHLREILAGVPSRLHAPKWVLLELEASGNVKPVLGISTAELMRKVASARAGYPVAWDTLGKMAKTLLQTENVALACYPEGEKPRFSRFRAGIGVFPGYLLLIQGLDKSYWEITAQESEDLDGLEGLFRDTGRSTVLPEPEPKSAPEPEAEAEETEPESDAVSESDSEVKPEAESLSDSELEAQEANRSE